MKVVLATRVVYPFQGYGGAQRYTYSLAKHLIYQGAKVEIVTNSPDGEVHQESYDGIQYTLLPPPVYINPLAIITTFLPFTKRIANYLRKKDFDILHSFSGTSIYYSFFPERVPIVAQGFGNEPYNVDGFLKIYNYITHYPAGWWFMKSADVIAVEGDIQAREVVSLFHVDRSKIVTLTDGVDLSSIQKIIRNCHISRQDLGLKDDDYVLINVNRLASNKGVNYLIEAVKILREQISNLKLIIIGTGPEELKIISMIKNYGLEDLILHFKNVEDSFLFSCYSLADVFVCPTLFEGLPLVVLEAMACGLPIVATHTGENPQVVKPGVNGYLVPVASPEGIADKILKIYRDKERVLMGKRSAEMVKNYDWKIIAKKAIQIYEELCKNKGDKI